uniref:Uncharacterized protein LOC111131185 n=1 Tax=Crassostrea virginica TaxID=6565 RepID=A0A8B8E4P7_CRAVI|nr:uncharacterized protein LOC111131185 [Crassostrea virginica]
MSITMAYRAFILFFLIWNGYYDFAVATCETPKCTCTVGGEQIEVEQNLAGNEALAGTVGALSSLLLTGSGFGLYMLYQKRCKTPSLSRQVSDLSVGGRKDPLRRSNMSPPPPYQPDTPASRNIYRAGMKDPTSHRVGSRSDNRHVYDKMSDWN